MSFKKQMSEIMTTAWQICRTTGESFGECLRRAWMNYKLRSAMMSRIVKFYFQKVDGTIREAYGSLASDIIPQTQGTGRKANDTVQTYYDSERQDWRCFKKANLLRIA